MKQAWHMLNAHKCVLGWGRTWWGKYTWRAPCGNNHPGTKQLKVKMELHAGPSLNVDQICKVAHHVPLMCILSGGQSAKWSVWGHWRHALHFQFVTTIQQLHPPQPCCTLQSRRYQFTAPTISRLHLCQTSNNLRVVAVVS